ncbi:MAG: cytochrome c [Chitinophagaceae bacterium]|nr:cytochrome c [Chitinophagaceae bacterium]
MKNIIILIIVCCFFTSCYYDKSELIYPTTTCDTTNIKYSTSITTILNANCNSCHGGTAIAGASIKLDTYNSILNYVKNNTLINSILQNGQASPMPKGGGKLAACDIQKIQTWINAGAQNN